MNRPALKQLLADIEAGKVNCVVVYKVDRLSRSLMDFARMLEVFVRNQVAFVSVTQQFNTTNSMGKLMLNVLLFAECRNWRRKTAGSSSRPMDSTASCSPKCLKSKLLFATKQM